MREEVIVVASDRIIEHHVFIDDTGRVKSELRGERVVSLSVYVTLMTERDREETGESGLLVRLCGELVGLLKYTL